MSYLLPSLSLSRVEMDKKIKCIFCLQNRIRVKVSAFYKDRDESVKERERECVSVRERERE